MHHSSQRDNNQNTRNPCKHWFAGASFYQCQAFGAYLVYKWMLILHGLNVKLASIY